MSFSIVIPSRNVSNLAACIGALRTAGETARVIVVWDGDSLPNVCQLQPSIWESGQGEMILGTQPFCFARNCNIGIRAAGTDDVVLLNDDALLKPGVGLADAHTDERGGPLALMAFANERHPQFGVVSAAVHGLCHPAQMSRAYKGPLDIRPTASHMLPFVAVHIRRSVLGNVGLLDESFTGMATVTGPREEEVYGGEDDDFCYRVRMAGYQLGVFNGAVVDHGTLPSTFRPDGAGRSVAGARQRFFEIHGFPMGSK